MTRQRKKIKLTWTELRHQRSALERFELYLPTLKLKQQQLQMTIVRVLEEYQRLVQVDAEIGEKISTYRVLFNDAAGINVSRLSEPEVVRTSMQNIAGVTVPVFESVAFPDASYSLFGTPPWVDSALADLRERNRYLAELRITGRLLGVLQTELRKVVQRVNLFEKIIIPETRQNIRRIRIALGDRMTAAVARAKIAKAKIGTKERKMKIEGASK